MSDSYYTPTYLHYCHNRNPTRVHKDEKIGQYTPKNLLYMV